MLETISPESQGSENPDGTFLSAPANFVVRSDAAWTTGIARAIDCQVKRGRQQLFLPRVERVALTDTAWIIVVEDYLRFKDARILGRIVKHRCRQVSRIAQQ